jgi:hypothetical protein
MGWGASRVGVAVVDLRSIYSGIMTGVLMGVVTNYGVITVHWCELD